MRAISQSANRNPHSGLTLIELLVVITILVLLVSSALPVLSPTSEGRLAREASRMINSYLAGAQARAIQTGRPYGVMLRRLSTQTGNPADRGVCLELAYVEQPAPFAGFDEGSRVILGTDESGGRYNKSLVRIRFVRHGNQVANEGLPQGLDPDLIPPGLFRRGDTIEVAGSLYRFTDASVDAQGYYTPSSGTPTGTLFATPIDSTGQVLQYVYDSEGDRLTDRQPATPGTPQPYWSEPQRYKVIREPTVPLISTSPPLQLPEGAAIDLRASGTTEGPFERADEELDDNLKTTNDSPIVIMFTPEGSIDSLTADRTPDLDPHVDAHASLTRPLSVQTVYLLVGLRENIPAPAIDFATFTGTNEQLDELKATVNWLNGEARWVSIASSTGAVATSVNTFVDPVSLATSFTSDTLPQLRQRQIELAREQAKSKAGAR